MNNPIPNSKPFPKGTSGNPNGRPRKFVSKLIDQGYKLSEINDTLQAMLAMTISELKEVFDNPNATVIEKTVAAAIKKSIEKGNLDSIETLLSRLYGKPRQTLDVLGDLKLQRPSINFTARKIENEGSTVDKTV